AVTSFTSPSPIYPLWLLLLSLPCSPNKKGIMDFIKRSLNATDTIFSTRETFAAGYVMDSWAKWRVMCMAPLSLEDIEDIYLFVTLITGFLLMGFGGALLYRRLVKAVCAAQNPTVMDRKLENIMEKLAAMQRALDLETSANLLFWPRPLLETNNFPRRTRLSRCSESSSPFQGHL
ncbi:hypothetical protein M9458_049875, partial [Cirrhinus mrigala]